MKAYAGIKGYSTHSILILVVDGNEWSVSHPYRFTPEKELRYLCIGGWLGHREGLNIFKKRSSLPRRDSNPGHF
jgi:hypothetical protein